MSQTIYLSKLEILQFLCIKDAVYNQERFQIKSGVKSRVGFNGTLGVYYIKSLVPREINLQYGPDLVLILA